jgi:hypothetical protein
LAVGGVISVSEVVSIFDFGERLGAVRFGAVGGSDVLEWVGPCGSERCEIQATSYEKGKKEGDFCFAIPSSVASFVGYAVHFLLL